MDGLDAERGQEKGDETLTPYGPQTVLVMDKEAIKLHRLGLLWLSLMDRGQLEALTDRVKEATGREDVEVPTEEAIKKSINYLDRMNSTLMRYPPFIAGSGTLPTGRFLEDA